MPKCDICSGIGVTFGARGSTTCPKCLGKGEVSPPSRHRKILICGEAFGAEEERLGLPFVGAAGRQLDSMLEEAGINKLDCHLTNVFNLRPENNDIKNLGTDKSSSSVPLPDFQKGVYLQNQYYPEVQRLWREIEDVSPNLILALGNTALWALTGSYGIRSLRGTITETVFGKSGLKVLPTYHPAAVLRDWSMRSVVIADLMKAHRQAEFPEVRRPFRKIWVEPDIRDLEKFYEFHIKPAAKVAFDIETVPGQITCIGFAPSPQLAIVIPFVDNRKPGGSFWPTAHQEKLAWGWVGRYLQHVESPEVELVGQNTLYDINWLWHKVGLTPRNYTRDTMLKHHAINPELEKGLGFLGSIYTDEPAWKIMRGKGAGTIKRGE